MKLVTSTSKMNVKLSCFEAIRLIKEAGFDGFDYDFNPMVRTNNHPLSKDDYLDYIKKVKAYADELGIPCLQAHAPFFTVFTTKDADNLLPYVIRALECCAILECPLIVVHPGNELTAEQTFEHSYSKLLPLAKRYNVKIATENMWAFDKQTGLPSPRACGTIEDFIKTVDMAQSEYLVACMDIGHAELVNMEGAPQNIRALAHRVQALHVHDNNTLTDEHILPFNGKIDWEEVLKALADINYSGHFTFEANWFIANLPPSLYPSALSHMHEVGRYLIKRLEQLKIKGE